MPITKNDLINETAISCGATRDNTRIAVEQFFDVVKDFIKAGNSLELRGFGTFSPKTCNPRTGRNLKTGELIPLASSKSMSFKFSSYLKTGITSSLPKASEKQPSKQKATATASSKAQAHELAKTGSL